MYIFTAKPLTNLNLTCTSSSVYYSDFSCDNAMGSSTDAWVSNNDGTSAWVKVEMSSQTYVSKLEIKSICANYANWKVKEVKFEFDDGSLEMVITIQLVWGPGWGGGGPVFGIQ